MKKVIFMLVGLLCFLPIVNAEETYSAQIGDVKYSSVSAALEAAKTGDEIILLQDVNQIDVTAGHNITLNLNGHVINKTINNNGGTLTITGDGTIKYNLFADGIYNGKGGTLVIDGVTFDSGNSLTSGISNDGNLVVKNVTFVEYVQNCINNNANGTLTIEGGLIRNISNYGIATINGGTFTNWIKNQANLVVNGGSFAHEITNTRGTVTINGGNFTGNSVAVNYDASYLSNIEAIPSTIIVNNGNFTVKDSAFANAPLSEYSIITINGGSVVAPRFTDSKGGSNNKVIILGGTFTYTGEADGDAFYASAGDLVIGKNDGTVTNLSPVITINAGRINGFGNSATFEFYDGKFIFNEKLDNLTTGFKAEKIPEGYYVKYDQNDDSSYTAYLAKIETEKEEPKEDIPVIDGQPGEQDEPIVEEKPVEEEKQNVEETVENPPTGLYVSLTVFVVTIFGVVALLFTKKKNYFNKI